MIFYVSPNINTSKCLNLAQCTNYKLNFDSIIAFICHRVIVSSMLSSIIYSLL